ncbi:acetyl-CoA C-acyltransferase [Runella slithyformis]|uniref:acetyl-CoA C-acetyltransferase n=1 Tax=Runella slithyformis (strain ATCC 29530 / DSM 19594 / LMG 11500 / NCIMB 11436 / LSU 4) TaxID=761193 RepID=A0A7U4E5F5_RUNSL|nr:acetyl-CoA C-acyltransferase [Runella slithyformis]AEI48074.1 acetyl-CoA acetyltransferase [Runella slithyformis DSM 19594]
MQSVYIVSAVRTPIGSFGGSLSGLSATQLGAAAIRGALSHIPLDPQLPEAVYMGNVVSANLGQAPARQAAIFGGLSKYATCTTVNKVCASGMKSVMMGAQDIVLGQADIVVTGGMESMSNAPFYLDKARFGGYGYGNGTFIDGLAKDGLVDVYGGMSMGVCADATAAKYGFSREEQDAYTIASYQRSAEAWSAGHFGNEVVSVEVPQRKGDAVVVSQDEEYKNVKFDKIPTLRPAFGKDGTVTAASSSTINDGAAALILMSERKVKELGITPLARIVSFADAEHDPEWFTTAPTIAAPKALKRAGLTADQIDFYEVNEAFAVVTLAFMKEMGVAHEKINVFGGGVSLGHPLGCSGARIVVTLQNVLTQKGGKYGLAAICNGGGGASAIIIEKV